jgi:hypothetical protein
LAIDVFEHIEDYFGFLRALHKKGKYKIFHIPLEMSAQVILRGYPLMQSRQKLGHLHYFSKETALATLQDTGYQIVDYFYTTGGLDLPARSFKTFLAKLPRKILYTIDRDIAARLLGGFSLMVLTL